MSELDRQQTRNIVWLQLAPVARMIQRVSVAIKRSDRPGRPVDFSLQFIVILKSGKRVNAQATRRDLREAILAATDAVNVQVFSRGKIEKPWLLRVGNSLAVAWGALSQRVARRRQPAAM
jgi:hypothetical protein